MTTDPFGSYWLGGSGIENYIKNKELCFYSVDHQVRNRQPLHKGENAGLPEGLPNLLDHRVFGQKLLTGFASVACFLFGLINSLPILIA